MWEAEFVQDSDGGLARARADYVAQRQRKRREQQAQEHEHQSAERRISQAGEEFVTAVREQSLDLIVSEGGYLIDHGSIRLQEDMYSRWKVVVNSAGKVLVVRDERTSEEVLSHYEGIYGRYFKVSPLTRF
jgi:hypothetical protein